MTVESFDGRAARRRVSDLIPEALALIEQQGRVPPRYLFMRELRIGPKKADELLEALEREEVDQKVEKMKKDESDLPGKVEKMKVQAEVSKKDESTVGEKMKEVEVIDAPYVVTNAQDIESNKITTYEDTKDEEMKEVEELLARKVEKTVKAGLSLTQLRWIVRGVLMLGMLVSIAGNVLHADGTSVISQVISAWSPIALLLSIEMISLIPVHTLLLVICRRLATGMIAGIAAWVSYWHMASVASQYGETNGAQYLLPLSVDGLVVVASICLVEIGGQINAARNRGAA